MTYNKAREDEREEKKKQEEMNKKEANEKRKRDMFEEEEKQWNVKVRDLELEAMKCEETLKVQEEQQKDCMKKL